MDRTDGAIPAALRALVVAPGAVPSARPASDDRRRNTATNDTLVRVARYLQYIIRAARFSIF